MDVFSSRALTVVLMTAGSWVLSLVVRSAVLSALRAHAEDQAKAAADIAIHNQSIND